MPASGRSKALDNQAREWLFNKTDVLTWAAQRDNDTEDIEQAKLRKLIAEASREELKLAVERKEVVEVEEVLSVVETEYANVRAKLLSLPTKATPLIVGVSDQADIAQRLKAATLLHYIKLESLILKLAIALRHQAAKSGQIGPSPDKLDCVTRHHRRDAMWIIAEET